MEVLVHYKATQEVAKIYTINSTSLEDAEDEAREMLKREIQSGTATPEITDYLFETELGE